MSMRAALALLLALVSTPLAAAEAVFPGKTWEMPGASPPAGWDAERLQVAEARFQALRPTGVMVVHDGRVVADSYCRRLGQGPTRPTVGSYPVARSRTTAGAPMRSWVASPQTSRPPSALSSFVPSIPPTARSPLKSDLHPPECAGLHREIVMCRLPPALFARGRVRRAE